MSPERRELGLPAEQADRDVRGLDSPMFLSNLFILVSTFHYITLDFIALAICGEIAYDYVEDYFSLLGGF